MRQTPHRLEACSLLSPNSYRYSDVWRTVRSVYRDMMDAEGWNKQNEVIIEEVNAVVVNVGHFYLLNTLRV